MRGAKAKAIRRAVYGDLSLKEWQYYRNGATGQVVREKRRRTYRAAKAVARPRPTATDRVFVEAERRAARLAFRRKQAEARKLAHGEGER